MPSSKSGSPWKVLIAGLVVCTVCFLLAAGGGVYWLVSLSRNHGRRAPHRELPQREMVLREPEAVDAPQAPPVPTTNQWAEPRAVNPPPSQPERVRRPSVPKVMPAARNAILAGKAGNGAHAGDDLFRDLVIPQLDLEVPAEGVVRLEINPRTYVRATLHEGKRVYTNVAVRLKGGPGSFRRFHDTPSFTVNFEEFAPGQTFHGLKKIHLNSSVQDNTRLNEKICRELFEAAGVPAPRAGHAVLSVNGRDPRLYVVLEGVNKQFLKRYFKDAKGNVYDGHSGSDVTTALPINSGEEPRDRLRDLARAVRETDLNVRLEKLEQTLDLDRFLSFMALEMMLSHWDGYTMGRNNYRIAHDRDHDRMIFIPHGMDQMFGNPRQPILSPTPNGLVARAALQIPEVRQRYRDRLAELTTNVFNVSAITNRVWELSESIAKALEEVDPDAASNYRAHIAPAYARRIQQRGLLLQREVKPVVPGTPVQFDQLAVLVLTNWTTVIDLGEAQLRRDQDENGRAMLYIGTSGGCTASWRTTALLDRGRYRLEARIKTRGVELDPADPRAGAGLRISRHRNGQKNEGDRDWTPITFEFGVEEDRTERELVCELRANKGEIWYDVNSFKLKKL